MTTTIKIKKCGIGNAIETGTCDQGTSGVSQVGIGVIVSMAGLVGVWGFICLISGVIRSGGFFDLARGWMTAIGM